MSSNPAQDCQASRVDENHLAWLLWFAMKNGDAEVQSENGLVERVWRYEHIGIHLQVHQRSGGRGVQHIEAKGRQWSIHFHHGGGRRIRVDALDNPLSFWRDFALLRLCEVEA